MMAARQGCAAMSRRATPGEAQRLVKRSLEEAGAEGAEGAGALGSPEGQDGSLLTKGGRHRTSSMASPSSRRLAAAPGSAGDRTGDGGGAGRGE